jgi:hypothetical protein
VWATDVAEAGWTGVWISTTVQKHKDTFISNTEIRLGISNTRRLLAEIVAVLPCQINAVAH